MRSTKISPEVVGKSVRTLGRKEYPKSRDEYQNEESEAEVREEHDVRRQSGYWQARSMFLNSYHFSENKDKDRDMQGWKKTVKNKAKETNKKAKMALAYIRQKALVSARRFDVKMLALRVELPKAKTTVKFIVPTIRMKAD